MPIRSHGGLSYVAGDQLGDPALGDPVGLGDPGLAAALDDDGSDDQAGFRHPPTLQPGPIPMSRDKLFLCPGITHCPRYDCDVSRYRNSPNPQLGFGFFLVGAGWDAAGLVVPGGVECEFADEFCGGGVDDSDVAGWLGVAPGSVWAAVATVPGFPDGWCWVLMPPCWWGCDFVRSEANLVAGKARIKKNLL